MTNNTQARERRTLAYLATGITYLDMVSKEPNGLDPVILQKIRAFVADLNREAAQ